MWAIICCNPQSTFLMFRDFVPIYLSIELNGAWTKKQLQLVATNPGWQSSSYPCSYVVARFISLLTFFRSRSLHCINCVATRNLAAGYVEISVFGRIRSTGLEYDRILRGGSKVPHMWDQWAKKKYFFPWNFQPLFKIKSYWFYVCG